MADTGPETKLDKIFAVIENYGKATAFLTVILLSFSVFYDYNFLRALRLSFSDVPTSIADHFRTAILWIPPTMLVAFATLLLTLILRIYSGKWFIFGLGFFSKVQYDPSLAVDPAPSDTGTKARRRRPGHNAVITLLIAALLLGTLVIGTLTRIVEWDTLYDFFMPFWFYFSFWILRRLGRSVGGLELNEFGAALFVTIPIMFAYVGKTGYLDAINMARLHQYGSGRQVLVKTEDGFKSCKALGLRRFSTAAIVVGEDEKVAVLLAERILEVRVSYGLKLDSHSSCP